MTGRRGLSGNALKLIGAAAMTVDHIGFFLFPQVQLLRYVGRLALPIFAYMVGEGCRHTRNRARYFLQLLALAVISQAAYTLSTGSWFLCVPVSFTLGVPVAICVLRAKNGSQHLYTALAVAMVGAIALLHHWVGIDYGVAGCLIPAAAVLIDHPRRLVRLLPVAVCLVLAALEMGAWQWPCLLALPLLYLYSGKRGRLPLKYFFYVYYPVHLVVIQAILRWC